MTKKTPATPLPFEGPTAVTTTPAPEPQAAQADPPQLPWLVGDIDGLRFRSWDLIGINWTKDPAEAIQFYRREDAEAFATDDEDAWKVVQLEGDKAVPFTMSDSEAGARFAERRACIAIVRAMGFGSQRSAEGRKAIEEFRLALVRTMAERKS